MTRMKKTQKTKHTTLLATLLATFSQTLPACVAEFGTPSGQSNLVELTGSAKAAQTEAFRKDPKLLQLGANLHADCKLRTERVFHAQGQQCFYVVYGGECEEQHKLINLVGKKCKDTNIDVTAEIVAIRSATGNVVDHEFLKIDQQNNIERIGLSTDNYMLMQQSASPSPSVGEIGGTTQAKTEDSCNKYAESRAKAMCLHYTKRSESAIENTEEANSRRYPGGNNEYQKYFEKRNEENNEKENNEAPEAKTPPEPASNVVEPGYELSPAEQQAKWIAENQEVSNLQKKRMNDYLKTVEPRPSIKTSPRKPIKTTTYTVDEGDTMESIIAETGLTEAYIRRYVLVDEDKESTVTKTIEYPEAMPGILQSAEAPSESEKYILENADRIQNHTNLLNGATYIIEPGDTLSVISQKTCNTIEEIVSTNGISNPNMIYVGADLKVSKASCYADRTTHIAINGETSNENFATSCTADLTHIAMFGDHLLKLQAETGVPMEDIAEANAPEIQESNGYMIYVGQEIKIPCKNATPLNGTEGHA